MFRIETADPGRLKRIIATGAGALIVGLVLATTNLVGPLFGDGYDIGNLVFGVFGLFVILLATHPTYQAADRLDALTE